MTSENSGSLLNGASLDGKRWEEVEITWSGEGMVSDGFGRGKDGGPKEGEETRGGEKPNHAAFWKALLEERFLARQALSEVGLKGRRTSKAIVFGDRGEARENVLERQLSEKSKRGRPKKVFERASERASETFSKKAPEKGLKRALSGKAKAKFQDEDKKAQMIERMKRLNQPLDLSDLDIHAAASKSMERLDSLLPRTGDALGSKANKSKLDRSSSKSALPETVHVVLGTAVHTEQVQERQEGHRVTLVAEASQPITKRLTKDRKETHRQRDGASGSGDSSSEDEPILTRKKPGVKKGDQSPLGANVNTSVADTQTVRDTLTTAEEAVVPDLDALVSNPGAVVSNSDALVSNSDALVLNLDALVSNPEALVLNPEALVSTSDALVSNLDAAVRDSDAPVPDLDDERISWAAGVDARSPERPENPNTPERPEEGGRTVTHLAEPEGCVSGERLQEEREKQEGEERENIEGNEGRSETVGNPIGDVFETLLQNPGAESEKGKGPGQVDGAREKEREAVRSNDSGLLTGGGPSQEEVGLERGNGMEDRRSNDVGLLSRDALRQGAGSREKEREDGRSNDVGLLSRDAPSQAAGEREKADGTEGREQGRCDDGGLLSGDAPRQVEGGRERGNEGEDGRSNNVGLLSRDAPNQGNGEKANESEGREPGRSDEVGLLSGDAPRQVEGSGRERENGRVEARGNDVGLLNENAPSQGEVDMDGERERLEGGSTAVGVLSGNAPTSGVAPPVSGEARQSGSQVGASAVSETGALALEYLEAPSKSSTEGAGVALKGPMGASEGPVGVSKPEGVVSEPEGPSAAAESLGGPGEAPVASSENPEAVSEALGAASEGANVSGLPEAGEGQILVDGHLSEEESARRGWEMAAEARQNRQLAAGGRQLAAGGEQLAGVAVEWSTDRVRAMLKSLLDHFRAPVRNVSRS
jgi:hypothetical protein